MSISLAWPNIVKPTHSHASLVAVSVCITSGMLSSCTFYPHMYTSTMSGVEVHNEVHMCMYVVQCLQYVLFTSGNCT